VVIGRASHPDDPARWAIHLLPVSMKTACDAIAVATAAKHFGISATIVMPADAPKIKLETTRSLGAEVVTYDRVGESREEIGARFGKEAAEPVEGGLGERDRLVDLGGGRFVEGGGQVGARGGVFRGEGVGGSGRFAVSEELLSGQVHEGLSG
jgi:hypothetical protein